jgi:hypothetical protein
MSSTSLKFAWSPAAAPAQSSPSTLLQWVSQQEPDPCRRDSSLCPKLSSPSPASLSVFLTHGRRLFVLAPFPCSHSRTKLTRTPTPLLCHLPAASATRHQQPQRTTHHTAMSRLQQDQFVDDEEEECCPLCVEEFDLSDRNFRPCPCGYQVSLLSARFCSMLLQATRHATPCHSMPC